MMLIVLGLLAGTAGALIWLKGHQQLGKPGIKATPIPGSAMMKIDLPEHVLDFTSTNVPESEIELGYFPKDTSYARRLYQAPDGFGVSTIIILMGADRTSIHRPEYCLLGQGWSVDKKTMVKIPIAGVAHYELPVMKWVISKTFETPGRPETGSERGLRVLVRRGPGTDHGQRPTPMLSGQRSFAYRRVATLGLHFVFFHLCAGPGGRNV